jgi:hypothetical protein
MTKNHPRISQTPLYSSWGEVFAPWNVAKDDPVRLGRLHAGNRLPYAYRVLADALRFGKRESFAELPQEWRERFLAEIARAEAEKRERGYKLALAAAESRAKRGVPTTRSIIAKGFQPQRVHRVAAEMYQGGNSLRKIAEVLHRSGMTTRTPSRQTVALWIKAGLAADS